LAGDPASPGLRRDKGAIYSMKAFGIVPRFVGKRLSGKKGFIALGLTASNETAARIYQRRCAGSPKAINAFFRAHHLCPSPRPLRVRVCKQGLRLSSAECLAYPSRFRLCHCKLASWHCWVIMWHCWLTMWRCTCLPAGRNGQKGWLVLRSEVATSQSSISRFLRRSLP
jgi:hypothetical protein